MRRTCATVVLAGTIVAPSAHGLPLPAAWTAIPAVSALTPQAISFAALAGKTYGAAPFTVSATASSGLPVSFASLATGVCTVSGTTVTVAAPGTCTIQASQGGNATYAAAPSVNQAFTVAKAGQTITFGSLAGKTYGNAPFSVSATASSGLTVAFASTTTAVCTVSATTVTIVAAGTCTIQASQAGNPNYAPATAVSHSFAVAKANQTIAFASLPGKTYGNAPFTVSATASSALAVAFASTTTAVCTLSSNTVTLKAAGTCTIQATQSGNGNYNPATAINQSFTVAKASQSITFGALPGKTYGNAPFTVSATASSALAVAFASTTTAVCTVSSNAVTLKAAGSCTIQATQAGNANYLPAAAVNQTFAVAKADQTITFGALPSRAYPNSFTVGASASSGLVVTFASGTISICTVSGTLVTLVATGTCTLHASQAGNANYNAAPTIIQSFSVTPAAQTITFPAPGNQFLASSPYSLFAHASSGLAVVFTSQTPATCTISAGSTIFQAAGTCIVTASQPGNANYAAATPVVQSFRILDAPRFTGLPYAVGQYPSAVIAVDWNGDAHPDLAVANAFSSDVSLLRGSTAGAFASIGQLHPGGEPLALATGDFNGDGKLDLAVADFAYGRIYVYTGSGGGTFTLAATVDGVPNPIAIAAVDLDRDGRLDLVVANGSIGTTIGQTVTVLLGHGDATFTSPTFFAAGSDPYGIAAADFNGDGNIDIAVAAAGTNEVAVLLGSGDGTFGTPTRFGAGIYPDAIAVGDFNGDGKPDLAVGNDSGNDVSILLGRGDGTFAPATSYPAGSGPSSIAVADLNGDGAADAIVANRFDNTVSVLLGNGDGTFMPQLTTFGGTQPESIATADLNGDGRIDIVVASAGDNAVYVLFQNLGALGALLIQSGDSQSAAVGTAFAVPFAVLLRDATGQPSSGQTVDFVAPSSGASGTFPGGATTASVATDASGIAAAPSFTANATTGAFTLTATAGAMSASFALTNTAGTVHAPAFVSTAPASATLGAPYSFTVAASGTPPPSLSIAAGALPVGLALDTLNGRISGTPTVAGTYTGTLQAANGVTPNATQSFSMVVATKAVQTIAFDTVPAQALGGPPLALAAAASSGLPVSFTSLTPASCTVGGSSATLVAAGSCTVRASQAGNASYAAAPDVDQTFIVSTAAQTIAFATPANQVVGASPVSLVATASSGLAVTFVSLTATVCTVTANSATLVAPGTCTIRASQAGNATYAQATDVDRSFSVTAAGQTIMFVAPADQVIGTPSLTLTATATSGLPVTFRSLTTSVCTVSGNKATLLALGTCTIRASQAGNATYPPAPDVDRSFAIAAATQSIAFAAPPSQIVGAPPVPLVATASSSLPVSFASLTPAVCAVGGTTAVVRSTGTCAIRASQAGNASYAAAIDVDQTFVVAPASQTISFPQPHDRSLNFGSEQLQASASSGLAVSFTVLTSATCTLNGDRIAPIAVGTCSVRASQAGSPDYLPATNVDRSFAISLSAQSIAFWPPGDHGVAERTVILTAEASSGLPITFTSSTSSVCTTNGNLASLAAPGTCTVAATQAGNATYAAASALQSFQVVAGGVLTSDPPATGPFIEYLTYLGGLGNDSAFEVRIAPDGGAYAIGAVASTSFPGAMSTAIANAGQDLTYVAKLDGFSGARAFTAITGARAPVPLGTGSQTLLALFQSGSAQFSGAGQVEAAVTDAAGNVYVAAYTSTLDFPARGGTYTPTGRPGIYKVSPAGDVQLLGLVVDPAVQTIRAMASDASGALYIAGYANPGLATTPGVVVAASRVTAPEPYLLKYENGASNPSLATYLSVKGSRGGTPSAVGQSNVDAATTPYALVVDSAGNIYLTGQAATDEFPATVGAPDTPDTKYRDAFVAKLNATATAYAYVARIGGVDADRATSIALAPDGGVIVGIKTASQAFGTSGVFQSAVTFQPGTLQAYRETALLVKLRADGTTAFSAAVGTSGGSLVSGAEGHTSPLKVAVDTSGAIYAAGTTDVDRSLPVLANLPNVPGVGAFLMKVSADGTRLLYSTTLGLGTVTALAVDDAHNAYVAGFTRGFMPTVSADQATPALGESLASAFVAKLNDGVSPLTLASSANPAASNAPVTLTATLSDLRLAGPVEFLDGGQLLGAADVSGGRAVLTVNLAVGVHRLAAVFRGAGAFDGSASTDLLQIVNQPVLAP